MAALSADARAVVRAQRLGFVATVNADGTPNLSPKGTLTVWDDDHLVFADLDSPGTVANLRRDPRVEVNVVDPFVRKGYRFRGEARVIDGGEELEAIKRIFAEGPLQLREEAGREIRAAVLIRVTRERPLVSPGYRGGISEEDMRARWIEHYLPGR
jgi:predicted pyridoxine 5'-phosphate oxidase superfamily flavin-nucleotide-binding protein